MTLPLNPLIPANAGIHPSERGQDKQIQNSRAVWALYEMGPGIRRDERPNFAPIPSLQSSARSDAE